MLERIYGYEPLSVEAGVSVPTLKLVLRESGAKLLTCGRGGRNVWAPRAHVFFIKLSVLRKCVGLGLAKRARILYSMGHEYEQWQSAQCEDM